MLRNRKLPVIPQIVEFFGKIESQNKQTVEFIEGHIVRQWSLSQNILCDSWIYRTTLMR